MRHRVTVVCVLVMLIPVAARGPGQEAGGSVGQGFLTSLQTPQTARAYCNRGYASMEKGEYEQAIADYAEAIRLDPAYLSAYGLRGSVWYVKEEYDKCIADLNEAIRLDPRCADAYGARAWLWATCPVDRYRDGKRAVESATRAYELTSGKEGNIAATEHPGRTVAHVGAEIISLDELKEAVRVKLAKLPDGRKSNRQELMMLTRLVLDMLVERRLLTLAAKQELHKPVQMQVIMEFADRAWREEELGPLLREMDVKNESELKVKLTEQGRSLDVIRESYRLDFLARGYMEVKLNTKVIPSDTEVRDYYNAHSDDFRHPDGPAPFAEVRDKVRSIVGREKSLREGNAFLDTLRRQTVITTIFDEKLEGEP
jgi:hypothetical protein